MYKKNLLPVGSGIRELVGFITSGAVFFMMLYIALFHLKNVNESTLHDSQLLKPSLHLSMGVTNKSFQHQDQTSEEYAVFDSEDGSGLATIAIKLGLMEVMMLPFMWIMGIMCINFAISIHTLLFFIFKKKFPAR